MTLIKDAGFPSVTVLERGRNARTRNPESLVSIILSRKGPLARRNQHTRLPLLDETMLLRTLAARFAKLALFPNKAHPWPVGRSNALATGYPQSELDRLPEEAQTRMCGASYLTFEAVPPGSRALDVGAGAGADALRLAVQVGDTGSVLGIEVTEELRRVASANAREANASNVSFERGSAEALPVADESMDLVIANYVLNGFVADKARALREIQRVLLPGGQLFLADLAVEASATDAERASPAAWAEGIVGLIPIGELTKMIEAAGLEVVQLDRFLTTHVGASARFALVARKVTATPSSRRAAPTGSHHAS